MIALLITLLFSSYSFAQFSLGVNIGSQAGLSGDLSKYVTSGFGLNTTCKFNFSSFPIAIAIGIGYDDWPNGNSNFYAHTHSMIFEVSPMYNQRINGTKLSGYVGFSLGIMCIPLLSERESISGGPVYSPFIGVEYDLLPNKLALDLNIKYSNYNQIQGNKSSWYSIKTGLFYTF